MFKSPLLLKYAPPTTPPLCPPPCIISTVSLSDPSQRLWGGNVTKWEPSNWHPTLWKPGILHSRSGASGFSERHTHLYLECAADSNFACVLTVVREWAACGESWVCGIVQDVCRERRSEGALCLCVLIILVSLKRPWCRSHQHLLLDPRLPASSMSQASHIPALKHTTMYVQQTRHNSCLYVQCVGISWQSYLLFASYLMNSIFQRILLTFCVVDPEVRDIGHGDYPVDFVYPLASPTIPDMQSLPRWTFISPSKTSWAS